MVVILWLLMLVAIAIGISLPELVTTIVAVRKWQCYLENDNVFYW